MKIFLFDIDGTLLHTGGAGLAAIHRAMADAFDVAQPKEISLSGRTDRGIAEELFAAHQLPSTSANWTKFRDAYLGHLRQELPRRNGSVLPGALSLVERLASRSDAAIGLLTGNVRAGAMMKLAHFAIDRHFVFGGFGDDHAERDDVARQALQASRDYCGERSADGDQVWVIGDTPLDIRCARHIGARVVAVATGTFRASELAPFAPDLLVEDLGSPLLPDELLR